LTGDGTGKTASFGSAKMLTILQLAIGITYVFLLFSLIVSAANELVQTVLGMRAKQLKQGIGELLQDRKFENAAKEFSRHPLISSLSKGANGSPSYIAPGSFVITLLDLLRDGKIATDNVKSADLGAQIRKIENSELRRALSALFDRASQDYTKFEQALETWFNEAMDRVSGWYKRWILYWLFGLGLALAIGANVDTIHIISALSTNPQLQSEIVSSVRDYLRSNGSSESSEQNGTTSNPPKSSAGEKPAGESLQKAATDLASLGVPLGWAEPECAYVAKHWWGAILGWLITALAASMGAPFWFDTLNRFINIRAAGPAPDEPRKGSRKTPKTT
jgi:hypothetical protein